MPHDEDGNPLRLMVAREPDEDGQYLLFFLQNGVTIKCGYIFADHVEDVQEALRFDD